MAQTLTLDLPSLVYDTLTTAAKRAGRPVEEVASDWVEKIAVQATNDPLLQLAGAFESDIEDVAAQHDRFLGEQLKDTHD
jgi:hypothetical protein